MPWRAYMVLGRETLEWMKMMTMILGGSSRSGRALSRDRQLARIHKKNNCRHVKLYRYQFCFLFPFLCHKSDYYQMYQIIFTIYIIIPDINGEKQQASRGVCPARGGSGRWKRRPTKKDTKFWSSWGEGLFFAEKNSGIEMLGAWYLKTHIHTEKDTRILLIGTEETT